jgi:hypothetical protein
MLLANLVRYACCHDVEEWLKGIGEKWLKETGMGHQTYDNFDHHTPISTCKPTPTERICQLGDDSAVEVTKSVICSLS